MPLGDLIKDPDLTSDWLLLAESGHRFCGIDAGLNVRFTPGSGRSVDMMAKDR